MSDLRYPVYIPSKGRAEIATTPGALDLLGIDYRLVVEDVEADEYARVWGESKLLVLPFSNLGQGSIPARNWIWQHALDGGHARHWLIDDNVRAFYRMNHNRRLAVASNAIFRAAEDFTDRYENIAFSGFQNIAFAGDRSATIPPIVWNTRIYSMTLIDTSLPYRWRGRYNEDTDLCLRALKDGLVTCQFNAFLGDKATTQDMPGGNTDNVYNTGDHRRAFAESLRDQHPDVVEVVWKFDRWHHKVDYSPFKGNAPILKQGITPTQGVNEYGMTLVKENWREAARRRRSRKAGAA